MAKPKLTLEEKKAKADAEEKLRKKDNLETQLKSVRDKTINPPSIKRKVGDKVQYGFLDSAVIAEILEEGKIYLLDLVSMKNNYGNPITTTYQAYVPWHDVTNYKTLEEQKQTEQFSYSDEIRVSQRTVDLSGILNRYYNKTNMNPEYQRGDAWTLEDKVALIDSIYNNVDIGKFTFIVLPYSAKGYEYEILDGKQRLQAIVDFTEGRFEYRGKKYQDMHPMDLNHLDRYLVVMSETESLTLKQKCNFFLKLNVTGKPQSKEHLNKIRKMAKD